MTFTHGFVRHRRPAPVRRDPAVIAAEKAAADAKAMTCQICGRRIFAEAGVIAHHGYQRPYEGVQTASCYGARKLPFEVTCDDLQKDYDQAHAQRDKVAEHRAKVAASKAQVVVQWEDYWLPRRDRRTHSAFITPETFEAVRDANAQAFRRNSWNTYERAQQTHLGKLDASLNRLDDYLRWQRGRLLAWKATHRAGTAGEATWVAL